MPNPGQANNPDGVNGFDHFAAEPPYGEATQQTALASGAPLAGAPLASGAIQAPQRDQRAAAEPATVATPEQPSPAQVFAHLASLPGATPLIADYARRANLL